MTELTYTQVGDYYLSNLTVGEQNTPPLGKYGRMRRTYLKEHSPVLLNRLVLNGTLFQHLTEIDRTAQEWLDHAFKFLKIILVRSSSETKSVLHYLKSV